jgi:hypothetical protein
MWHNTLNCGEIEPQAPLAGLVTEVTGVSSNPGLRRDRHGELDGGEGGLVDRRIERYRPVWLNQPAWTRSNRPALVARRGTRFCPHWIGCSDAGQGRTRADSPARVAGSRCYADWTSGLQDLTTALFPDARRAAPERATSAVAGFPLRAIWITVDDGNRTRSRAALLARVLVDIVEIPRHGNGATHADPGPARTLPKRRWLPNILVRVGVPALRGWRPCAGGGEGSSCWPR